MQKNINYIALFLSSLYAYNKYIPAKINIINKIGANIAPLRPVLYNIPLFVYGLINTTASLSSSFFILLYLLILKYAVAIDNPNVINKNINNIINNVLRGLYIVIIYIKISEIYNPI